MTHVPPPGPYGAPQGDVPPQQGGYHYQPGGYPPHPSSHSQPYGGSALPHGVVPASKGRRVGAYFLAMVLIPLTLGIGYFIWGIIAWSNGTSPALQVLGMRVWREPENRVATFGDMAMRNIVGGFLQSLVIMPFVSFFMFLSDNRSRTIPDRIANTIVVHDPAGVIPK